jgi:membrane protease YdiL (CAAX protease family)
LQWLWTVVAPLLIVFCFFVVFPALISDGPPHKWAWRPGRLAGLFVPMFNYNLLAGPLFEEFGWRGFLQSRLQRLMPAWIAATLVGALWTGWHLPLFLLQGWTTASPSAYLLILVGVSLVVAFGFNSSGRSVLAAILMHSAFNSSPRFLGQYLGATPTRTYPGGEWYIAASFLLVGVGLAIASRGRLTSSPARVIGSLLP